MRFRSWLPIILMIFMLFPAAIKAFAGTGLGNVPPGEVLSAADILIPTPANIDGDWLDFPGFGVDPKYSNGSQEGLDKYLSVQKQKDAYSDAKADGNLQKMLSNSFWTTVQAWALFNHGKKIMNADGSSVGKCTRARPYFEKAIGLLAGITYKKKPGPKLAKELTKDKKRGKDCLRATSSYLTHCKRVMGDMPWPKGEG